MHIEAASQTSVSNHWVGQSLHPYYSARLYRLVPLMHFSIIIQYFFNVGADVTAPAAWNVFFFFTAIQSHEHCRTWRLWSCWCLWIFVRQRKEMEQDTTADTELCSLVWSLRPALITNVLTSQKSPQHLSFIHGTQCALMHTSALWNENTTR